MINKYTLLAVLLLIQFHAMSATLPIDTLNSKDTTKPLLFYISGDGGFNSFSTSLTSQWNKKGYPVVALDARSYFWKTKQPDAAAKEIALLIQQYMKQWKRSEVILAGYSLGADVLPFIQNKLPSLLLAGVKHTVLLSPSGNTDFTVHLIYSSDGGSNVPAEINMLTTPVLVVFGATENDVPEKELNTKKITMMKVKGNHHYDDIPGVVNEIIKRL